MGGRDRGDRGGQPRNDDDQGGRDARGDGKGDDAGAADDTGAADDDDRGRDGARSSDGLDDDDGVRTPIPGLEWAIAGVGMCLVVTCIGYLVHRGLTHDPGPPQLAVHVESVAADRGGHHVRFRVENRGGEAAAQIVVRGELVGGPAPETSEITIDLVPADAERSGGLYFKSDPALGTLEVHAIGYQDP